MTLKKTGIVIIIILIALAWLGRQEETKRVYPGFRAEMTNSHMVMRQNGEKLWEIKAGMITSLTDETVKKFTDIAEGYLYHNNRRQARFSAPAAIYDDKTGNVEFPSGLNVSTANGGRIMLSSAVWQGEAQSLITDRPASFRLNGSEAKAASLSIGKGTAVINANSVTIHASQGATIEAKALLYNDDNPEILLKDDVLIRYKDFQLTANSAAYNTEKQQLRLDEIKGARLKDEKINGKFVVIDLEQKTLKALHVTINLPLPESNHNQTPANLIIAADALHAGFESRSCTLAGEVKINWPNGDMMRTEQCTLLDNNKLITMQNNVIFQQGAGDYKWSAESLVYWPEKKRMEARNFRTIHHNGAAVTGNQAELDYRQAAVFIRGNVQMREASGIVITSEEQRYYEKSNQAILNGNVMVDYGDGRWVTADRMIYSTLAGDAELFGNIKAGLTKHK